MIPCSYSSTKITKINNVFFRMHTGVIKLFFFFNAREWYTKFRIVVISGEEAGIWE